MRQSSPGVLGQGFLEGGKFQAGIGYRWLKSDKHFTGDHEDEYRQNEGSEVINDVNNIDLSLTYAITKRYTATLILPFQIAERSQVVRSNDVNRTILERYHTGANGLGDIRVMGNAWLLNPNVYVKQNISLGLGLKLPTGDKEARDTFRVFNAAAGRIDSAQRTVDQSIQPGDGGYGIIFDILGFKEVAKNLTAYAAGTYIMTPEETSGVPTFRGLPEESVMSIADQFLGRAGVSYNIWPEKGISLSLGGRVEGVPVEDAIGGSNGFRRPGYAVSIEPGVSLVHGRWAASVQTPVAIYRVRDQSVPDKQASIRTGVQREGDAAFADFIVQASATYRF